MKRLNDRTRIALLSVAVWAGVGGLGRGQDRPQVRVDGLERPEGKRLAGTFGGDLAAGFQFVPEDGSPPIPIVGPAEIAIGGKGPGPAAGVPPVQVVLGLNQWISGKLLGLDEAQIRLDGGPGGRPVTIERAGALSLRQRPGDAIVLIDGFETLDPVRWSHVGTPKVVDGLKLVGEKSLRLDADGSAVTARLAEPIAVGRLELAYHDTAAIAQGAQWFVDFLFRGEGGPETLRAVLGWNEDSLGVLSTGAPVLAVQRLARKPGWHRLEVRFGPDAAEMAVDGDALAHGKGPTGPLIEIRLGTSLSGDPPPGKLAVHLDELRLVRSAPILSAAEPDPDQDEVRLIEGDQVFGEIRRADPQGVSIDVLGKPVGQPWSQVSSLHFRRVARPSREVEGLLCRVEWRSAPGDDARDLDRAEGALIAATPEAFTLDTPYAGRLVIPRDRVRHVVVDAVGRRLVVDPKAHHLGDEVSKAPDLLDPPQPEGGVLERSFPLARLPEADRAASLVFDVVQVVGEANGLAFSDLIRLGQLRTKVSINGRDFDYINKYVTTLNDTPERIRMPITPDLLKVGENRIKIVQVGKNNEPNYLDDLGILGIAVEFAKPVARP